MNLEQLKTASFDDIVFDGRNKEYGAYELRKQYGKRLIFATILTIASVTALLLSFAAYRYFENAKEEKQEKEVVRDVELADVQLPPDAPPPPPPPPPDAPPPPPKVETVQYTTPKIVDKPENPMKSQDDLEKKENIGDKDQEGEKKKETKQEESGQGVKEIPDTDGDGFKDNVDKCPKVPGPDNGCPKQEEKKKEEIDQNAITVPDTQAQYDGDWNKFLNRNLEYPEDAIEDGIQGTVIVKFEVDKDGNVSNVKAVSGPKELRSEAERAIKRSGKWKPGIKSGINVRSYRTQQIVFRLE